MSRPRNVRRVLGALVPVLSLAVGATFAGALPSTAAGQTAAAATSAVPPATKGATIDWFDAKYAAVAPGSVFETATLERFEYLLKKPGKFAFVIGGPEDATLQNALGHIDAVAKANGITKVYNFDPRLDGKDLDVFDPSRLKLSDAGKAFIGKYGTALVDNYLGKDAETPFTQAHTQDPYLFVYDGSGGDTNRITAALTAPVAAADLDTPAEVTAYREDVADVLTSAGTLGVDTQFDFLGGEHNRRHDVRYPDDAKFGGDIFDSSDATDGFRVQSVTYPELLHILQSPGDFALLFGGTWCHNTAAIIKATNKAAQQNGIKTVYAFDFVLNTNDPTASNGSGNLLHIRDNALVGAEAVNSRPSYLYGDLVNTYLSNAFTQYRKTGDPGTAGVNPVRYYPGGDPSGTLAEARKIQVGHLLTYNKDHKDAQGNPAPVLDQAIRKNTDGTFTEYMTEWWYVQGQDLPRSDTTLIGNAPSASEANLNAMENQRAFAKEGIGRVRDVLAILGGGHASTVSATLSESVAPGVVTPVQVSVSAPDYSGFRSLNTANAGTAPASTVDKPTGRIEVREGATVLTSADLVDGAAAIDLPGLAAGSHSLTFHYSGSADGIVRESTATRQVTAAAIAATAAAVASTTTVSAPSTTHGKAATVTVSVAATGAQPTGAVTLTGTGSDLTAPLSGGKAVFTLPSSLAAGTRTLTASYAGDASVRTSAGTGTLVVGKARATSVQVTVKKKPTTKTSGKAVVKVVGVATGVAPTGKVLVKLTSGKVTKKVRATLVRGKAVVALPKVTRGSWKLAATYRGDANYDVRSARVVKLGRLG